MATIEPEWILDKVEPLSGRLVTRILQPTAGLEQCRGAEVAIAIPPIARAGCCAAGAQDAFVETIELLAVAFALAPFLLRGRRFGLQPWFDRGILRVELRQIGHQVLDHRHMRQRIDFHRALDLVHAARTGKRVGAVDIHRARAAHAFTA